MRREGEAGVARKVESVAREAPASAMEDTVAASESSAFYAQNDWGREGKVVMEREAEGKDNCMVCYAPACGPRARLKTVHRRLLDI